MPSDGDLIMSFLEEFQIVSNLGAAETNTFRAQEILTGRPVLVHQIMSVQTSSIQPDLLSMVYTYLPGAGTPGTEHFLDSGEDDDCIYIVTSDVPECLDLRQWLQFIADSQGVAGSAQGESGSTEGSYASSPDDLREGPPVSADAPTAVVAPVPKVAVAAGRPTFRLIAAGGLLSGRIFTIGPKGLMIGRDPANAQVVVADDEVSRQHAWVGLNDQGEVVVRDRNSANGTFAGGVRIQEKVLQQTDEFSLGTGRQNIFRLMPSVASPPLTPETSGPGEFTQMFKGVGKGQVDQPHASSMPPARTPKASSPQPPSEKTGPGEFTLMFSAPQAIPEPPAASRPSPVVSKPSVPPSASPAQKQPGEFTMLFHKPPQPVAPVPPAAPPPPVVQAAPPPPKAHQPGEYTSIFEAPRLPPTPPQAAPQAGPPAGYGYPAVGADPPPPPAAPQAIYPQAVMPPQPQYQPPPPPAYAMAPPAVPQAQPAAIPPPQPIPPAGTKKPMIFWVFLLLLGCLFLSAVVLVLVLALKH